MTFIPGIIVKPITTKSGREVLIRYPKWEDLESLTEYINALSQEDTFITYSGEGISRKEEADFICSMFKSIEFNEALFLVADVDGRIVGISEIHRDKQHRQRSGHVGVFGLTIAQDYRGEGLGYELAVTVINEAKDKIVNLNYVTLTVYQTNNIAQNLYGKLGFIEIGKVPKGILYRGEFQDCILMGKALDE